MQINSEVKARAQAIRYRSKGFYSIREAIKIAISELAWEADAAAEYGSYPSLAFS